MATPGRLLQHMDETPGFDAGGLRLLVLDEADRILDMVRTAFQRQSADTGFVSRVSPGTSKWIADVLY